MPVLRVRSAPIAATTVMICVSAAAEPVHFTNPPPGEPGHADWLELRLLDITRPSAEQVGVANGFNIAGTFRFRVDREFDEDHEFNGQRHDNGVIDSVFGGRIFAGHESTLGLLQPGDIVGPGGFIPQGAGGGVWTDHFTHDTLVDSSLVGPLGEHFLGVSFIEQDDQGDILGDHFGFIGFNLFEREDGTHGLYATQWGYETELDTAIAVVPAPGAATALLGAGALLATRRRRYV